MPRELWWDNPRTVAVHLFRGRERALHPRYAALASHYTFAPRFCLPARGNEKPKVEHRVFDLQRRWATPVPRVNGVEELNTHLRRCCLAERASASGDNAEPVGVRFERDRAAALAAPARRFDACVLQPAQVDKYQTVRFDHNSYSVPRRWAFRPVTVKGYVERVEVVADGQVVARHPRSYGNDPLPTPQEALGEPFVVFSFVPAHCTSGVSALAFRSGPVVPRKSDRMAASVGGIHGECPPARPSNLERIVDPAPLDW